MFKAIKIEYDKLEPSKEYYLSDGTTSVLVRMNETATKFTIQPSRVLGLITNDKQITFDLQYMVSQKFFTGCTTFFSTEGIAA